MTEPINTIWSEGGPSGLGWSEVDAYLRCPKEYQFAKVRGMSKMQTNIPDYFAIGSFMHAGRARWFAQKFDTGDATWQLMRDDITKVRCDFKLPCNDSAETTALRYLQEYVDHWGVREKPQIVAVEHMLGPTELWPGMDWTERTSRLDDFGFYPEAGGKLMIGELKTTAAPVSDVANQYTLHGQPLLQRLLWELAPQGGASHGPVGGMVLDIVQKGYGGKRCNFSRLVVPVDERPLAWFRSNLVEALEKKAQVGWNTDVERRISSCTRLVGKARVACEFRDVCQFGRQGVGGMAFEDGSLVSDWQKDDKLVDPWA